MERTTHDAGRWTCSWRLEKYAEDEDHLDGAVPYEVIEGEGNLLVNAGIDRMLDLLIGAGGTTFNAGNAYIGVGDSTTAAAAGQTDLQASTNKLRKAMDATYPSRSAETVTWKATFGTAEANWVWNEWAIFNASSAGTMLNRKVAALGTKATGSWAFTASVSIA